MKQKKVKAIVDTYLTKRSGGMTLVPNGNVEKGEVLTVLPTQSSKTGCFRVSKENGVIGYVPKFDVKAIED